MSPQERKILVEITLISRLFLIVRSKNKLSGDWNGLLKSTVCFSVKHISNVFLKFQYTGLNITSAIK